MKTIHGDIYTNTIISSLSEVPAYLFGGMIYHKTSARFIFSASYLISLLGGIFLLSLQRFEKAIPVMVLLAKFGVASTFNICYLANSLIFPTIFAGTAFGVCNFFGKLATITSPLLAEVD
jgi:hypothetical protein